MTVVAELRGVRHRYRGTEALRQVDLAVHEHTITGLLGRNGAGKTTVMRLLAGHLVPSAGRVEVFGAAPFEDEAVLRRLCLVRDDQRYPDTHRVGHVLRAAAMLCERWDDPYARSLLDAFELPADRHVRKLSRGMRSALGVIVGLAARAPLTCFDEPYLGLDAVARQRFYDLLLEDYAEHPRTVLLSTHLIDEVGDLLEHVVVIDRGRVVIDDDAESLRRQAVTVTGPADVAEAFAAGRPTLKRDDLGSFARITVTGTPGPAERAEAAARGLDVSPVSLQELVVRATTSDGADRHHPAEHQEVLP